MRLYVHHLTEYRFSEPQARLVQLLRLTPESFIGQNVVDWRIDVDCNARLRSGRDGYGNETTMLYVDGPIDRISITVNGSVLTENKAGMVQGATETLPPLLYMQSTRLTTADEAIIDFARGIEAEGNDALDRMHLLMGALHERLTFDPGRRDATRTAIETFSESHGVCQDFAHVFVAAARAIGIPARYVSGHFYRDDGAALQEAAHAWAEAHIPDYGWIAFDASHDHCPDDRYIRVAIGLDYRDAAPLSGSRIGGGVEELDVGVRVGLSQSQTQG
ncbi:transglutaminase family protein [Flavisphingomonas formosensis]|uniref:transglutaminase family protein n=1 Tax=Flavisphingomonas formosensis TaxID=861534 RepID=UPI0012FC6057|nr:transglutaminase family protein [Sphingomonas formosensis]